MDYINENLSAKTILLSGQNIAVPGGRENGSVVEWLNKQGIEYTENNGRCLHPDYT